MERAVSAERALKNAFASAKMEGFRITPEIERHCKQILNGETNIEECVREMLRNDNAKGGTHVCTQSQLHRILQAIYKEAVRQFGDKLDAVILYGSYARGDYDDESDIDVMVRVKLEKEELSRYWRHFSNFGSDLGLENDIMVSVHLQDFATFEAYKDDLPFYRNVQNEGVLVRA